MTIEEAKEVFINRGFVNGLFDGDKWRESVVIISKWLEQDLCEDVVSRQAMFNILLKYRLGESKIAEELKDLPPVIPQQKCEDIAKAFQIGLALGFGEKHDETDKIIDGIKKVVTPKESEEI